MSSPLFLRSVRHINILWLHVASADDSLVVAVDDSLVVASVDNSLVVASVDDSLFVAILDDRMLQAYTTLVYTIDFYILVTTNLYSGYH